MASQGYRRAFVMVALAFGAAHAAPWLPKDASPLAAFMQHVATASAIADPLERCLKMPDPPGTHWNAAGVAAYCRYHAVPTMTPARFQALMAQGKAATVDREFAGYLRAQMDDPAAAGRLDHAMYAAGFHDASEKTRAAIDAWKRQRPDSAFAFAASGMQYRAEAERGGGTATPPPVDNARADFDRAVTMTPAIPSIYADMFLVGAMTGDTTYAQAASQRGLAMQPGNLSLRLLQASVASGEHGGSRESQIQQRAEAAALADHFPLMWVVAGRLSIAIDKEDAGGAPNDGKPLFDLPEVAPASDLGHLASWGRLGGDGDAAMILAVEALRFDSGQEEALEVIGAVGRHNGYAEWSKAALKRATAEHPGADDVARVSAKWLREF